MSASNLSEKTSNAKRANLAGGNQTATKASQLNDYVESPASSNAPQKETNSRPAEAVDSKVAEMSAVVEMQLARFLSEIDEKLDTFLQSLERSWGTPPPSRDPSTVDVSPVDSTESMEDSESEDSDVSKMLSDWDRRKMQMLAELGDPQAESLSRQRSDEDSQPTREAIDDRALPRLGDAQEDQELDALHDTIASLSSIDAEEIDELKRQLAEALRDAEVELSINRANLAQQWAALERKQHEMSQHEMTLKSKYGNLTEATKNSGLLGRFSRHLSRRSD